MRDGGPANPMRAAQANMRPPPVRRFYKAVGVREEADGLHALTLDGRGARTPGRNALAAASRARDARRVAEEWARQGETLDPADMPLTRLLNSAIDGVAADDGRDAGRDRPLRRLRPPLLPRRGAGSARRAPARSLRSRSRLGGRDARRALRPGRRGHACRAAAGDARGLSRRARGVRRPGRARGAQRHHDAHRLRAAGACGRARAPHGREAWRVAHVDEDFQIERWGEDAEATARRAARWREMEAAGEALAAAS